MTTGGIQWKPEISLGTVIQIVSLALTVFGAYLAFDIRMTVLEEEFKVMHVSMSQVQRQTDRLEHYEESKDPNYWKDANEHGDADGVK